MTNEEIFQTALRQSAIDCNCEPEDFLKKENTIVRSVPNPDARKYLDLPLPADLVTYGNGIVASVSGDLEEVTRSYISRFPPVRCFETPNLLQWDEALVQKGMRVCFMAEYFLPDVQKLCECSCSYSVRVLEASDFAGLYLPEWGNALCEDRKELDVLAVGAYDGEKLVGLAGCSADCESMWQIGIDVLPEYRRQGIASALTSRLALETLWRGKVPFYCAAWSNLKSVRNALRCGFRPAWVELTAKSCAFVETMMNKA